VTTENMEVKVTKLETKVDTFFSDSPYYYLSRRHYYPHSEM